ncbi:hypothetical protein GCM10023219_29270 [Stakelama sediminis]|nr:Ig-like domain-containing protein [Stakelama sediminis]
MKVKRRFVRLFGVSLLALSVGVSSASETTSYSYDVLGRLTQSSISGGPSSGWKTRSCFDHADNRTNYYMGSGTPPACSAVTPSPSPTPVPSPSPSPSPTPTPAPTPTPTSNQAPVTQNDSITLPCGNVGQINLIANDSDPDGNTPLTLKSIVKTSGISTASVSNSSTAQVVAGNSQSISKFTYTVADSLGKTATGTLTVTATCSGGINLN